MRDLYKKSILVLFSISLVAAIMGDLLYTNIDSAKGYMVGEFIYLFSTFAFTLAIVCSILYLFLRVIFKDFINKLYTQTYSNIDMTDRCENKTNNKRKMKGGKKQ